MTTITSATIASMTRTQVWAYIADNSLPVAKKRSTEDARKELIAYIETLAPAPVQEEEPVIEQPVADEPAITPATYKHSAAIVAVMILVAIQVILTKLVIPAVVTAIKLVILGYGKAKQAYKQYAAAHPHTDSLTINYFDELEVG